MFSKRTILAMVDALNFQTHNQIERFLINFELDEKLDDAPSIGKKVTVIVKYLINNPSDKGPNGAILAFEIMEYIIENCTIYTSDYFDDTDLGYTGQHTELEKCLGRDGYILTNEVLRRNIPSQIPIVEQEDELILLLEKYHFDTAKGHYEQAISAHSRNDWAAANAQLRSFVEEFFNKIQTLLYPSEECLSSNEHKISLAKNEFFIKEYNEYLFNGTGFVEGFWKRLHPEGSHPGLSEQSDSTFRLHLTVLVIHHFIVRLNLQLSS